MCNTLQIRATRAVFTKTAFKISQFDTVTNHKDKPVLEQASYGIELHHKSQNSHQLQDAL